MTSIKVIGIQERMQERLNAILENNYSKHVSFFYKPQQFMLGNSLNMFKYSQFILSISETEIVCMSKEDYTKFEFSRRYIKEEDEKFYKLLEDAADKFNKS